ncbi:MAG: hypothetical protein ACO1NV_05725 [Leptospira bouyouniensis]
MQIRDQFNIYFDSDFYGVWYDSKLLPQFRNSDNSKGSYHIRVTLAFKLWEDERGKQFEYHSAGLHAPDEFFYFINFRTERDGRYFRMYTRPVEVPNQEQIIFEFKILPSGELCITRTQLEIDRIAVNDLGGCKIRFSKSEPDIAPWNWNDVWHPSDEYSPLYRNNWNNREWIKNKQARYEELLKVWNGVEPAKWKER